jgi:acetyl-CoA synthetase
VYYAPYPGYYFTGDSAIRDDDGCYWIKGRVDDVVNVSAHRLSTAELEAALLEHPAFAEVAVVGVPDQLTGQAVVAFISQRASIACVDVKNEAIERIRQRVGSFAAPKYAISVMDLPRTRSGKIMRRLLRKIWCGEKDSLGDVSTLINPSCLQSIVEAVETTQADTLQV